MKLFFYEVVCFCCLGVPLQEVLLSGFGVCGSGAYNNGQCGGGEFKPDTTAVAAGTTSWS
jgi:hypothetical protein